MDRSTETALMAVSIDLLAEELDDFPLEILVGERGYDGDNAEPADLTGYRVQSVIRKGEDSSSELAESNFILSLQSANGIVNATLPKNHALKAGDYWYEIEVSNQSVRRTVLKGKLTVSPSLFDE